MSSDVKTSLVSVESCEALWPTFYLEIYALVREVNSPFCWPIAGHIKIIRNVILEVHQLLSPNEHSAGQLLCFSSISSFCCCVVAVTSDILFTVDR